MRVIARSGNLTSLNELIRRRVRLHDEKLAAQKYYIKRRYTKMTKDIINNIADCIAENIKKYVEENIDDGEFSGFVGGEYYLKNMHGLISDSARDEYHIKTQEDILAIRGKAVAGDLRGMIYLKIKDLGFKRIDIDFKKQERFYTTKDRRSQNVIYKKSGKLFYVCHLHLEW